MYNHRVTKAQHSQPRRTFAREKPGNQALQDSTGAKRATRGFRFRKVALSRRSDGSRAATEANAAAEGRHRAATAKRAASGRFTSGVQVAEQSISKQSKAATDADGEESGTKHIRTYGKESAIFSPSDAKSYFSNFIRLGNPTRQKLDAHLARQQCASRTTDPYRYEQRDLLTGGRLYCGRLIPADAPPRPNENAVWNEELQEWD